MMIGLFEPDAAPWNIDRIPDDFAFGEIEPDWDRIGPHLERAFARIPAAASAGVRKLFCGPESFTPDLAPLVGETPSLRNCWVAAGLNSLGILYGPGIGNVIARWIVEGACPVDHTGFNVDRFADGTHNTPAFRRSRTPELLAKSFGAHFPNSTFTTARGLKQSVLYGRLKTAGAYFTESHGWELPDWFAPTPEQAHIDRYSWGRQHWFDWHAEEHRAARQDVVVIDMSSMSKFLVQGRDACELLGRVSCNDVDVEPGRVVYTAWANEAGGFEADLTVTRLEADSFLGRSRREQPRPYRDVAASSHPVGAVRDDHRYHRRGHADQRPRPQGARPVARDQRCRCVERGLPVHVRAPHRCRLLRRAGAARDVRG